MIFLRISIVAGLIMAAKSYGACDTAKVILIEMKNHKFDPQHVEICLGQKVIWLNRDHEQPFPIAHTISTDPAKVRNPDNVLFPEGAEPVNSKVVKPNGFFEYTFTVAGEYKYFCQMDEQSGHVGSITVVKDE